jgi:plasmid stabilization system protein ParE
MKLRYKRSAVSDLDKIFRHIATDNPDAARRLVARVEELAALIAALPHLGRPPIRSFDGIQSENI